MNRISQQHLDEAVRKVRQMNPEQQIQLIREIIIEQPHMLGSVAVQKRLGVPPAKVYFALDLLLVCYQAMKESGLPWPVISEDLQEKCMGDYVAHLRATEVMAPTLAAEATSRYQSGHPERTLLDFAVTELSQWFKTIEREEADQVVILAVMNFVNCIARVPLQVTAENVVN